MLMTWQNKDDETNKIKMMTIIKLPNSPKEFKRKMVGIGMLHGGRPAVDACIAGWLRYAGEEVEGTGGLAEAFRCSIASGGAGGVSRRRREHGRR